VKLGNSKLKNNKSAGPDLVLNEFIKTSSNILLKILVKLVDKVSSIGQISEE
jgi:hypothetical protein